MSSSPPPQFPEGLEQIGYGESFKDELCDMLESIPMLGDMERRDVETLADFVQAYQAGPNVTVITEGQRDSYMWLVVDGKLDVYKEHEYKQQRKLATVRKGKSIGELCIIDQQPHSASVVTTTHTTLLLLTRNNFLALGEQHPRLGFRLLWRISQLISYRLRRTSGLLVEFLP